jgi:hypothetical protein
MNVEIGTEAAQFPEQEYINGVFLAVRLLEKPLSSIHGGWGGGGCQIKLSVKQKTKILGRGGENRGYLLVRTLSYLPACQLITCSWAAACSKHTPDGRRTCCC